MVNIEHFSYYKKYHEKKRKQKKQKKFKKKQKKLKKKQNRLKKKQKKNLNNNIKGLTNTYKDLVDLETQENLEIEIIKDKFEKNIELNDDNKTKMCDNMVNSCMKKNLFSHIFTQEKFSTYSKFFTDIIIIILFIVIIFYILTLNISIYYRLLKLGIFGLLFYITKYIVFIIVIYKLIYPLMKHKNKVSNSKIIKYIIQNDNININNRKNVMSINEYIKYLFSKEFNIFSFPINNFFKSLTYIDKNTDIYKNSQFEGLGYEEISKYIMHVIKISLFLWDYPFQYYYDNNTKRYKNLNFLLKEIDNEFNL